MHPSHIKYLLTGLGTEPPFWYQSYQLSGYENWHQMFNLFYSISYWLKKIAEQLCVQQH